MYTRGSPYSLGSFPGTNVDIAGDMSQSARCLCLDLARLGLQGLLEPGYCYHGRGAFAAAHTLGFR